MMNPLMPFYIGMCIWALVFGAYAYSIHRDGYDVLALIKTGVLIER